MQPVDPSTAATFPAAHESQLPWPVLSWYLPGSQSLHDDAALPLHLPAPQSLQCSDEAVLREPALQAVHAVAPLDLPV